MPPYYLRRHIKERKKRYHYHIQWMKQHWYLYTIAIKRKRTRKHWEKIEVRKKIACGFIHDPIAASLRLSFLPLPCLATIMILTAKFIHRLFASRI